jgi:hypothetical protein
MHMVDTLKAGPADEAWSQASNNASIYTAG